MMFRPYEVVISLLVITLFAGCQPLPQSALPTTGALTSAASPTAQTAPLASTTPAAVSTEAKAYLTTALDIMQQHALKRRSIDWTTLRTSTFAQAAGAQVPADTYMAIRRALGQLRDGHSYFQPPQATQTIVAGGVPVSPPSGRIVHERLADIVVWGFNGNTAQATTYIEQAHTLIATLDQAHPCGWIVDLRDNPGGNMWPMLASIGPIVGDGIVGAFVDPDGQRADYGYYAGAVRSGHETIITVKKPYTLRATLPPVAVLTGNTTASSGEAIVVAFRGRADTRSFGQPTAGLSTANQTFTLSDGASLFLTTAILADRAGVEYGKAIEPDEIVRVNPLEAAAIWLLAQPACRR